MVVLYNRARHEIRAILRDASPLELALTDRYLEGLPDLIEDYAASWDASREDPDLGVSLPAWSKAHVRLRAAYVALEVADCVEVMLQHIEYDECGIHDSMPSAWEITT